MSKAYVLVFNENFSTRENLVEVLNKCKSVITWRYDLSNAIYIISDKEAYEISAEIEVLNPPGSSLYMLLEYNGNAQGRTSEETWHLLNNKFHLPK